MTERIKEILARPTMSVPELSLVLGVGRRAGYAMVKAGEVDAIRVGSMLRVTTAPIRRRLGIEPKDAA